jgi:CheY-like chemotaxis protein
MRFELLIVDDDDVTIFLHKKILLKSNFHQNPSSFGNGRLALEFLLSQKDREVMHFILLDINMPVMNGWEFLDAVKELQSPLNMKVIVLTSSANKEDRMKAADYPIVISYIEKPVKVETFEALKTTKEFLPYFA